MKKRCKLQIFGHGLLLAYLVSYCLCVGLKFTR